MPDDLTFKNSVQQLKQVMRIKPDFKPLNINNRHRITSNKGTPSKVHSPAESRDFGGTSPLRSPPPGFFKDPGEVEVSKGRFSYDEDQEVSEAMEAATPKLKIHQNNKIKKDEDLQHL